MKNLRVQLKKITLPLFLAALLFSTTQTSALEPRLIIMSPAPGEVVASETLNVLIDTEVALVEEVGGTGYSIALSLDDQTKDLGRAVHIAGRGYIYPSIEPGLHTLTATLLDRDGEGKVSVVTSDTVEFQKDLKMIT